MQESYSLIRRFWDRPVCILVLAPRRVACLDVIWTKFEEVCKPQTNEVRARFDLLTSFRQGDHFVDEWYIAVQAQINLAKYPCLKQQKFYMEMYFVFSSRDEEFVSKTINDSNIDLNKFPSSKVRQLAQENGKLKSHSKVHQTSRK